MVPLSLTLPKSLLFVPPCACQVEALFCKWVASLLSKIHHSLVTSSLFSFHHHHHHHHHHLGERSPSFGETTMDGAALFQGFQRISRSKSVPEVGTLSPASIISSTTSANPNGSLNHSPPSVTDANPNPNSTPSGGDANNTCMVREQDRFMPIANVIRIMRKVLPTHAKISDEAKETIQECVSEYISFITSEANDRCQREQRKTITAEDIIWAMSKLGFDDYIEPLSVYLQRYRELEGDHRGAVRGDALPLKRSQSDVGGGVYGAPPPYSLGQGYHGYGGGYYMSVYGDGTGGSSPQGGGGGAMGGGGGYDPYGPYN